MSSNVAKFIKKFHRFKKAPKNILKSLIYKKVKFLSTQKISFDSGKSKLLVNLRTDSGLSHYRFGYWDSSLQFVSQILEEGDVFLDGGANIGMYSVVAASRVGAQGHVISIEPTPEVANLLRRSIDANDFTNCTIKEVALSDQKTTTIFHIVEGHSALNSINPVSKSDSAIEVQVDLIDNIISPRLFERLKLVKLDIEGSELNALQGARNTIKQSRPYFLIEIVPERLAKFNANEIDVDNFFEKHEYIKITNTEWNPNVLFCPREKYEELTSVNDK